MTNNSPKPLADFWLKRQNGAHRRFTTSIGALATLRRLLPNCSPRVPNNGFRGNSDSDSPDRGQIRHVAELRIVNRNV
jgi:hypothetical protein